MRCRINVWRQDYLDYVDDFVFGKFGIVETDVARLFGDPDFAEARRTVPPPD